MKDKPTTSSQPKTGSSPPVIDVGQKNHHVAEEILKYCRFPYSQRYALMVNGKWGSGKTHLLDKIKKHLIENGLDGDKAKPIYITLYGVRDAAEIGEQIYQQMHPFLSHKGTRFVGALIKGILKTTVKIDLSELHKSDLTLGSQLPDVKVSELLNGANQRIVIFDDFERATMPPVELLGYINPFVEHDGCKVIILVNEEAINHDEIYKERREKTVGKTLQLTADVDLAFLSFLDEINELDLRNWYEKHKSELIAVFNDSKLENLRILKQFLWDFERLWALLTPDQRSHSEAILEIARLLLAWNLEVRSNTVDSSAIELDPATVATALINKNPEAKFLSLKEITRKYSSVRFDSTLLKRETIKSIVLGSAFFGDDIRSDLSAHPYFAKPDDLPSWRGLWFAHDLPADDIPELLEKFEVDFVARRFIDEPELMHIIGLGLWFSDIQQPGWPAETVISKLKQYINDVYDSRHASPQDAIPSTDLLYKFGGAYGLSYRNGTDPRFVELSSYLRDKVSVWRERGLPALAEDLLKLVQTDTDTFLRQVCPTSSGPATYARLPVLKSIDPEGFAAAFGKQSQEGRKDILLALRMRYEFIGSDPALSSEQDWLINVYGKLLAYADTLGPIPLAVLRERINSYLKDIISMIKRASKIDPLASEGIPREPS